MLLFEVHAGKLPIEMNVDETSQKIARPDATESPPPIPPKMVDTNCNGRDFDHCDNDSSTKPKIMRLPPPLPLVEASPSLPPKPKLVLIEAESHILICNIMVFVGLQNVYFYSDCSTKTS